MEKIISLRIPPFVQRGEQEGFDTDTGKYIHFFIKDYVYFFIGNIRTRD